MREYVNGILGKLITEYEKTLSQLTFDCIDFVKLRFMEARGEIKLSEKPISLAIQAMNRISAYLKDKGVTFFIEAE